MWLELGIVKRVRAGEAFEAHTVSYSGDPEFEIYIMIVLIGEVCISTRPHDPFPPLQSCPSSTTGGREGSVILGSKGSPLSSLYSSYHCGTALAGCMLRSLSRKS